MVSIAIPNKFSEFWSTKKKLTDWSVNTRNANLKSRLFHILTLNKSKNRIPVILKISDKCSDFFSELNNQSYENEITMKFKYGIEIKGKWSDLYLFLSQLSWLAASLELRVAYPQFCWIQDSQIEIIEVVGLIGCLFSCT